jgi:hypothetical protein
VSWKVNLVFCALASTVLLFGLLWRAKDLSALFCSYEQMSWKVNLVFVLLRAKDLSALFALTSKWVGR